MLVCNLRSERRGLNAWLPGIYVRKTKPSRHEALPVAQHVLG
jgi:hypothetical protein